MTALEKLWAIVHRISEANEITPKGQHVQIHKVVLHYDIGRADAELILDKLSTDEGVIKVLRKPDAPLKGILKEDKNTYTLDTLDGFRDYRNQLFARFTFGLESLDPLNLRKIIDVAMDIKQELELTDEGKVTIPLLPSVVKFSELMPFDGNNFRDQYCEYRWNAVKFMKKMNVISDYSFIDGTWKWDGKISLKVDRFEFSKFFDKLKEQSRLKLTKAAGSKLSEPARESGKQIRFDAANHTLLIYEASPITFLGDDSNQAELCRVLLKDKESLNKSWNRDELLEAWGWSEDRIYDNNGKFLPKNRQKLYHAADAVNDKVMRATQGKITDFLIFTTKTVSVNSKYRDDVLVNS